MFFAKIPRHTRQNAITEGDSECILTRNCEGTEQLRNTVIIHGYNMDPGLIRPGLFSSEVCYEKSCYRCRVTLC